MMWWAWLVAAVIALPLVYLGWRRGAVRMLLDWVGMVLLCGAIWSYLQSRFWLAGGMAALAFALLLVRVCLYFRREESPLVSRWSHRLYRYGNSSLGAGLGVVSAALICLGVALVGASILQKDKLQRVTKSAEQDAPPPDEPSPPAQQIARACQTLANISNRGVLQHLPYLDDYGREVVATVEILNADEAQMRWLYHKHAMGSLVDKETLLRVMDDEEYVKLLSSAGTGNPAAIRKLKAHPKTHEILAAQRVQEFVKTTRPSSLLEELKQWPGPAAASQPAPELDGEPASHPAGP
jgi:hypothetical protein